MSILPLVFVAMAFGISPTASGPPEEDEKARWERLELRLSELESQMENKEWAVAIRKSIDAFRAELAAADRVEIYSLSPQPLPKDQVADKPAFHGYEILGTSQGTRSQLKEATRFLGKVLHWNELRKALCFNPRHGLRAICGKRTFEFLICFECNTVRVFEGNERIASFALAPGWGGTPFDGLVPGADKDGEREK